MPQHTPGPWMAVDCCEGCPLPGGPPVAVHKGSEPWKRIGAVCTMIAQGDERYDPAVTWSNARLIAAAPDLLRELTEFHDHTIDQGWHDCDGIPGGCPVAAAIAKARGTQTSTE